MSQELFDLLTRSTPAEARQQLNLSVRDLDAQVLQLTASLNGQGDSPERRATIAYTTARSYESAAETNGAPGPLECTPELRELRDWVCRYYRLQQQQYLTPEFLEWAHRTFDEQVFLAGLREIEATGGLELKDFIHELQ